MKAPLLLGTIIVLLCLGLSSGTPKKARFWKGNMHAHSYWSDGDTYPEEVAYWFKSNGYNFLAVTDHNLLQEGEKWYNVDRNETIRENYVNYIEHFGGVGLQTEIRGEQLWAKLRTLNEYRSLFEKPDDFLLIAAEEITDAAEKRPVHLNGINLSTKVVPAKGDLVSECLKSNVMKIRSALVSDGNPEWIIVNHPNFGWAMTADDIARSGARFFEVYNGHPSVRNYGDDSHPGTEEMWDKVNQWRIENGEALLLGIANDDSHHYLNFRSGRANPGRGWSMVRSEKLTPHALYQAMIQGDYYASTGVEIKDFVSTRKQLRIWINQEKGVEYRTQFIALIAGSDDVIVVDEQTGAKVKYTYKGNEEFVRAKVISSKLQENPFREGDVEVAWIQPVKLKK
ncbi:MAG: hypothetical protein KAH17_03990 [Bacteroidales bacterium]|nr:hypothetical protein [Bacteroidales bacterium]